MAAAIAEPSHLAGDLKALRLSTVAAQWQPLAEQAVRQRQAPADYLAQLVHLEVTARRERRIQRRIQDARFPMLKTLDAFSFEAQPDLDRDAVLQVFDCRFVAEAANVVFVGVGDEAAVEDLQDGVAVEVRLRLEREGVQRLEHREAGVLNAALDGLACGGPRRTKHARRLSRAPWTLTYP